MDEFVAVYSNCILRFDIGTTNEMQIEKGKCRIELCSDCSELIITPDTCHMIQQIYL